MITTLQKWGNSQGIRIPKAILDTMNWHENEEINMTTKNNKIIIEKSKRRKNIIELFDGYEGEYEANELDWGDPKGEEIW